MIDEINLQILKILQNKARIPNVEVARQVDMAPSAVLERIRKLEKQGYIDGYEVLLNPERCGRSLIAFVHVYARNGRGPGQLGETLAAIPDVLEVHTISGEDCYFLKLRVRDTAALGKVLRDRIQVLDGVQSTRTQVVFETYKETFQIPLEALEEGADR